MPILESGIFVAGFGYITVCYWPISILPSFRLSDDCDNSYVGRCLMAYGYTLYLVEPYVVFPVYPGVYGE